MEQGYYRFPTIHNDTVVFVCEGDLWTVPAAGGVTRRLTTNAGQATTPVFSPDGAVIAFAGRDEGSPEVYIMPAEGGPARRLTYLGANTWVAGWSPDGASIVFASNAGQPFSWLHQLYAVHRAGGEPRALPTGPAMSISYGPDGGMVIGRNTTDLARWKRYRGGLTGDLWIDLEGDGDWRRLTRLNGNVALPRWVADRVYFVSDHQGVGNLYSCRPTGEDLRRHTHHAEYYVRHPATDGRRIVYHAGADLFLFDPATGRAEKIDVEFHSSRAQRKRKFVDASKYVQGYNLHPHGRAVALTVRGRPFTLGNWEGAVIQHGDTGNVRYRLSSWLGDGRRLIVVSDSGGEELLEIQHASGIENAELRAQQEAAGAEASHPQTPDEHSILNAQFLVERIEGLDIGRPVSLAAAPKRNLVALSNHRHELILVDLEARAARVLDRSRHERIHGLAWSPDGRWLAYAFHNTQQTSIIRLCRVESGETTDVTRPVLRDVAPAFDPEGKYLYFLSYRDFNPVYDALQFDLNFPFSVRPYLVTLRADVPSPFVPAPPTSGEQAEAAKPDAEEGETQGDKAKQKAPPLQIDLEGIADRVVAFPVPAGRYSQIRGIKGKVLFSSHPVEGAIGQTWIPNREPPAKHKIEVYDFEEQSRETLVEGISSFDVSQDAKTLIYRAGNRLRVLKAGEKPKDDAGPPSRKSGWLDLGRLKVSVDPGAEWEQMYREAWRLQRDQFWTEDMSGIDWQTIYNRYLPLLRRVATRAEFSDLMWEMQGELGTSHAYEIGGDYPPEPQYDQGKLGADLRYDSETDSYLVERIVQGDVWDEGSSSPLSRPGVHVRPGDRLIAVNGRRLSRAVAPGELLVNQAGSEVLLMLAGVDGGAPRTVAVKTLRDETPARYRAWVDSNRQRVHEATGGRVGYVHIPDMGARGYAEFHRGYLAEVAREGLVVDVRFNGGGHVSHLILEKLARRRLGYSVQRWGEPTSYPVESVLGPIVAIANEQAGSDGDIFSHVFKIMRLGPLIGKRTWGGVIGINPRELLADGSITTQPEYSFWFKDVGWQVENYGTDPDVEVDIRPQDYIAGYDTQLERAIAEVQRLLAEHPPGLPDFSQRPRLHLPTLPDE
jgi:tricorn protease